MPRGSPLPNWDLSLGGGHGLAVGQPGKGYGSDSGQHTGPDADQGSAQDLGPVGEPFADAGEPAPAHGDLGGVPAALAGAAGDLGQPEHAQGHGHQGEPVAEEETAEGEAFLGGGGGDPDHAQQQAQHAGGQPLEDVAPGEDRGEGDTENSQHEQLRASEGEDQWAGQRDREGEAERSDDATGHRGQERQRQGPFGLSLAGHGVAVEHRDARRRRTGCSEQDGGDGVGGVHHGERADEERQGRCRVHAEGDGQEDGDGTGAAEAGDQPDDQAGDAPMANMISRPGSAGAQGSRAESSMVGLSDVMS